ncbi:MAG: sensor histidine kinase [Flavobacteriales bacterium]|nr:sensor histidine kinase [Flavobacteriales bacterium]
MSRRSILYFVFSVLILPAFGQTEDELLQKLKSSTSSKEKFDALRDLGYLFEFSDTAKAMMYYRQEMELAELNNNEEWKSKAWLDFGSVYYNVADFTGALTSYKRSLKHAALSNDRSRITSANINIGNAYYNLHQLDSAVVYAQFAQDHAEALNDTTAMILVYSNLSSYFEEARQYENCLRYVHKNIPVSSSYGQMSGLANAYIIGAIAYKALSRYDEMLSFLSKASATISMVENPYIQISLFQNLSGIFYDIGEYQQAAVYIDSAMNMAIGSEELGIIPALNMTEGKILIALNRQEEGVVFLKKAIEGATPNEDWQVMSESWLALSECYSGQKNYKDAYFAHTQYEAFKDSLIQDEIEYNMIEAQTRYQTEKQALQLKNTEHENEINLLKASKAQRNFIIALSAGILLLVIAVLLWYLQRRKVQLAQQKQLLQSEEIKKLEAEKQLAVVDSMLKGEEQERSRVAKDLHDGVGSLLSGVKLSLSSMKGNMFIQEADSRVFERSIEQLDTAIGEMRRVAHNMMPESLVTSGLITTIQNLFTSFDGKNGLSIHFEHHSLEERLPKDYEIIMYRMIQELLHNVVRHAKATEFIVQLSRHDKHITMVAEDNGIGFDGATWIHSTGMGFNNLKNRVEYLKGKIHADSSLGNGSSFLIEFDLP